MAIVSLESAIQHKTHLIFDFDETLFQLLLPWELCFSLKEKELRELDNELIDSYFHQVRRWSDMQNLFVQKHGERARKLILENNTRFEMEMLEGVQVNEGLLAFVKNLSDRHLFIWSSNTRPVIEKVLSDFGLMGLFEKIVTRTEVTLLKGHPEGFRKLYDPKIPKENYLMIGDSVSDKEAAKNAGIDFFQIAYF